MGDERVGGLIHEERLQGKQVLAERSHEDLGEVELVLLQAFELGTTGKGGVEVLVVPVEGVGHGTEVRSGLGDHLGEATSRVPAHLVTTPGELLDDRSGRVDVPRARIGRNQEPGHRPPPVR